jgi:hypothetical protein
MEGNWLVQGLLANWLSDLLAFAGVGLVTYLKRTNSTWFQPVLYGLAGGALVAVILLCGQIVASPKRSEASPENVETKIQEWVGNTAISVRQATAIAPNTIFTLELTFPNSNKIVVERFKSSDSYITLESHLLVDSQDQQKSFAALSQPDAQDILSNISLEMSRARIQASTQAPPRILDLAQIIRIDSMTEEKFMDDISGMENAVSIAKITFAQGLFRAKKAAVTQRVAPR